MLSKYAVVLTTPGKDQRTKCTCEQFLLRAQCEHQLAVMFKAGHTEISPEMLLSKKLARNTKIPVHGRGLIRSEEVRARVDKEKEGKQKKRDDRAAKLAQSPQKNKRAKIVDVPAEELKAERTKKMDGIGDTLREALQGKTGPGTMDKYLKALDDSVSMNLTPDELLASQIGKLVNRCSKNVEQKQPLFFEQKSEEAFKKLRVQQAQ